MSYGFVDVFPQLYPLFLTGIAREVELSETITLNEYFTYERVCLVTLDENLYLTEITSKIINKNFPESQTLQDLLLLKPFIIRPEVISITDEIKITTGVGVVNSETISLIEKFVKYCYTNLPETISLLDKILLMFFISKPETITLFDKSILGTSKNISEKISLLDKIALIVIASLLYIAYDETKKALSRVSAIPPVDNTYDIGATDYRFRSIYTVNIHTGDLVLGGRYRVIELSDGIYIYDIKTDKLYRIKISKVK